MRVTRLWWLLVPVAALAACSSSGDGGVQPAKAVGAAVETTTTIDPTTGFMNRLEVRLSGESQEFKQAAVDLSKSMCEALDQVDTTVDGDAPADTPQSDAALSSALTTMAMDAASMTGLDPAVTAEVLRTGAEFFCPDYTQVVSDYFAQRG